MASLLEAYKNRLAVSEKVYASNHAGEALSPFKKTATAKCLDNIAKYMNESFDNSVGTQRANLGDWKKFSLNLTTVAIPNLIAFDLVIVSPMSSYSGFINYIQYTAGSNKGTTAQGEVLNNPFRLGKVDTNYTSDRVVETFTAASGQTEFTVAWAPVSDRKEGTAYADVRVLVDGSEVEVGSVESKTGKITLKAAVTQGKEVRIAYVYDNVVIPQNDIPLVNAEMKSIALVARARRVAVYYSQIAAYQAKTDYGFDLGDQLAEKAVAQLNYEIDTEITQLLIDNATGDDDLVWSKTLPVGVSKKDHYEGFTEIVEMGKQKIYDRTQRFAPNYMLIASNILPILMTINSFSAAATGSINGPYFAGTLNGLKVFVTPNIDPGKFVLGVNGNDMMSSAAVYAPYMPIVPTQLLGYADGGMNQGFSTLYDLKLLNADLLVAGRITA